MIPVSEVTLTARQLALAVEWYFNEEVFKQEVQVDSVKPTSTGGFIAAVSVKGDDESTSDL